MTFKKSLFSFFLFIIPQVLLANFEYSGEVLGYHQNIDSKKNILELNLSLKSNYSLNEKRDDFGLLINTPDSIAMDFDLLYRHDGPSRFHINSKKVGLKKSLKKNSSLFIGDTVLIWGKADQINPLDVWNAEDYRNFLGQEKEKRKLSRTMLIYTKKSENAKFEIALALNDVRSYHQFPDKGSPWCSAHCQNLSEKTITSNFSAIGIDTNFESHQSQGADIGARYSNSLKGYDFSLITYYGADRFPFYKREFTAPGQVKFSPLQAPQLHLGFDMAKAFGKFTFFFEGKAQFDRPYFIKSSAKNYLEDSDGLEFEDEYLWVLGADRKLSYDIYANLQYFQRSPLPNSSLYDFGGEKILTLKIIKSFEEKYKIELLHIQDLIAQNFSETLEFQFLPSDEMALKIGYIFFKTDEEASLFSGLTNNKTIYIKASHSF